MRMYLNILCLVCINLHYTSNCAEFDRNAWIFSQFSTQSCSEINSNDNLLTEFVQTKVIMAPFTLITHQSFWQLIDHSVQHVLV